MFGKNLDRNAVSDESLQAAAISTAKKADVIVAALGEAAEMSGESSSRSETEIPEVQKELLHALLKTGKPVVLVLFTGRPPALAWEHKHVPAILNYSYAF